jgi:DNA-binding XRE family transcriptional regulator
MQGVAPFVHIERGDKGLTNLYMKFDYLKCECWKVKNRKACKYCLAFKKEKMIKISEKIEAHRMKVGMTQHGIAKSLAMTPRGYSKIIHHKTNGMDLMTAYKIASILEIDVKELL